MNTWLTRDSHRLSIRSIFGKWGKLWSQSAIQSTRLFLANWLNHKEELEFDTINCLIRFDLFGSSDDSLWFCWFSQLFHFRRLWDCGGECHCSDISVEKVENDNISWNILSDQLEQSSPCTSFSSKTQMDQVSAFFHIIIVINNERSDLSKSSIVSYSTSWMNYHDTKRLATVETWVRNHFNRWRNFNLTKWCAFLKSNNLSQITLWWKNNFS
jgi:hypothetical protein